MMPTPTAEGLSPSSTRANVAFQVRPTSRSAARVGSRLLLAVLLLTLPEAVAAQSTLLHRISLEPRVGVAFPTGDFGNVDPTCPPGAQGCPRPVQIGTSTGWRWGLRATAALTPSWSLFLEYGRTNLGCSTTFCGTEKHPGTHGLDLGLRGAVLALGSMVVWVEAAGVMEEVSIIRTLDEAGEPVATPVAFPWSVGAAGGVGAELDLRGDRVFYFTPGFRFRYVPVDPPDDQSDLTSVTATYMLFEIGFRVVLGRV